ncbi:anti-sigma factor [Cytophaga aurantiaca]|uniref:anti-sigma factor n=1 Tax=Cytophaga aurantiaca TaxID=29530 RepID=UPI00036047F9|nr:anti-sigma factor [Cytophaga aurantiaca]
MNIEEYISSGVLELYVLGALSKAEAVDVEVHAAAYPEIAEELRTLQATLEGFAQAHAIQPPAHLKQQIVSEIEKTVAQNKSGKTVKSISISNTSSLFNWLTAASIIVAIATSVLSGYFWSKWKNAEGHIIALEKENVIFAQNANYQIDSTQLIIQEKNQSFSFITDTATTKVVMKGLPISPSSVALVFWNKNTKEVFLDVKSLPVPPAGMQYQLWALDKGVPVDAGVFDLATAGNLQKLKSINSAQAFAVTLEKAGGSPTPTLEQIHILGTI